MPVLHGVVSSRWPQLRMNWQAAASQVQKDFGAESTPKTEDRLAELLLELKNRGSGGALALAGRWGSGWVEATQLYLKARAWREEELAAEVSRIRARLVSQRLPPTPALLLLQHRLAEVQKARQAGITPPQAVADKPEVVIHGIPRWVTYTGLAVSIVTLATALSRRKN